MRIGIDARLWRETGVGRYIRALTKNLQQTDRKNEYILFLRRQEFEALKLPQRWQKILADVHWHTVGEQIRMPGIYKSAKIDLLHIPYFSVPLFTMRPFVVTVHDLTISHYATGRATTRPYPLYLLKRMGYQFVLSQVVRRAEKIITVSETVKKQLVEEFSLNPGKVVVTYEAGDLEITEKVSSDVPSEFLLYIGNAHPHKNVEFLLKSFVELRTRIPKLKLVLVGKKDFFYEKIIALVKQKQLDSEVIFPGEVTNAELEQWYSSAAAFVFPSLSEGFGIPGLEAMQSSCPVVASDISVFHEIYGAAALYFNPRKTEDLVGRLSDLFNSSKLRQRLVKSGKAKAAEYSWKKMAEETLVLYESCISIRSDK